MGTRGVTGRQVDSLKKRVLNYASNYKQLERKEKQQIALELSKLKASSFSNLLQFKEYIDLTMEELSRIEMPICILYGELDETLYRESANYIYKHVSSHHKNVKGYSNSSHLMTLGKVQEEVHTDILSFLNNLQW